MTEQEKQTQELGRKLHEMGPQQDTSGIQNNRKCITVQSLIWYNKRVVKNKIHSPRHLCSRHFYWFKTLVVEKKASIYPAIFLSKPLRQETKSDVKSSLYRLHKRGRYFIWF